MPGYDPSWGVDESWDVLPPRLEAKIQEAARNSDALRGAEKRQLSMWEFPQEIRDCMSYIHRFCRVKVPDPKTGEEKSRRPSYFEIYLGMWEAGRSELAANPVVKEVHARRERVLRSGSIGERMVSFGWTPAALPFYAQVRKTNVTILDSHMQQAVDLADDFQTSVSRIGVVVFAAAVTTSDLWLENDPQLRVPYQEHARLCVQNFLEWASSRLLGQN